MIRTSCASPAHSLRRIDLRPTHRSGPAAPPPSSISRPLSHSPHRREPSKPRPIAQTAPASPKTIPGPSWLWLEPVYEPFRAYGRAQKRRPYVTQFVSALVIYFVGDIVAQSLGGVVGAGVVEAEAEAEAEAAEEVEEVEKGWVQEWAENRDWGRTGRALLIGGLAAVPGYRWFLWLSDSFNYRSKVLSLTTKVAFNQVTFTPVFNTYFFGMQSLLTGASFPELVERVRNTVPTSWVNSCKIWPAVTAFSFAFIPIEYRSIFGGVIAIGWQTYLSLLNQRAAAVEELEHGHEVVEARNTEDVSVERGREKCTA